MAFFRNVSFSEQLPAITGDKVLLRAPQMADHAEWSALRAASRDFLTPWEPTWPADDLTRAAFRRRIRRYAIVGICVLVAVITPSGDPISMLMLSVPMVIFYEIAILIGGLITRRQASRAEAEA